MEEIKFSDLTVDKRNGNVNYNDEKHIYWDDSNNKYISVTTLIGKYEQHFDKEFWSKYKALERLLDEDEFKIEKSRLLKTKKFDDKILEAHDLTVVDLYSTQQEILAEWDENNRVACERGTAIHAKMENQFYTGKKFYNLKQFGVGGKFECRPHNYNLDLVNGAYPEYLAYVQTEDGVNLAGQIDLLIKEGNNVTIVDFKGLPLDTPLPTKTGWTTMGEVKIGDELFDKDGEVVKVLNKSEIHYNPCFKITFDNNDEIIADHEHKWLVSFTTQSKKEGNGFTTKIMTTEEIAKWTIEKPRNSYTIPKILNPEPLNLPDKELPIDPYLLGCWLGDGAKSCGMITNLNEDLWEEIRSRGYEVGDDVSAEDRAESRTVYNIRGKLSELGVLHNKHIPMMYLRASYRQRLDLLRGLMDTDGHYHKKRKRFVMRTTQEWQYKGMIELLATLSIKSTLFCVDIPYEDRIIKGWDVCFSTSSLNPFLTRNHDIIFPEKDKNSFRNIKTIERVDTVPTQCIEVDSPSHTYLFGESMIITHNTNKKLSKKSGFDTTTRKNVMMKPPMNHLMDCNFMHYTIQLSTYAWMIEKNNPDLKVTKMMIIYFDHNGGMEVHDVEYIKSDIERLLKHYAKEKRKEELAEKRKKIEF